MPTSTLSPLAQEMMVRFKSVGEGLLCHAIFNNPKMFPKEVLEVNRMSHDTAIQFTTTNRLEKAICISHPYNYPEKPKSKKGRILQLIRLVPELVTAPNKYSITPLHQIFINYQNYDREILDAMLEIGDKVREVCVRKNSTTPLLHAFAGNFEPEDCLRLLEFAPEAARIQDYYKFTPLHKACHHYYYYKDVILKLLNTAPEVVRVQNFLGKTPLHIACDRGTSLEVVQAIVEIDPTIVRIVDNDGLTPLQVVEKSYVCYPKQKFIELLKEVERNLPTLEAKE